MGVGERLFGSVAAREPAVGETLFARVFDAADSIGNTYSIELVHRELCASPPLRDGVRQETQLSAQVIHPNVVRVVDYGEVDEQSFVTTQRQAGASLSELMSTLDGEPREVRWSVAQSVAISVAAGLDAVFAATGRPHGFCTPDAVLVSPEGDAKIRFLGWSRLAARPELVGLIPYRGHYAYISPEQLAGEPGDSRSDVYGLAATLNSLLGARERRGDEAAEIALTLSGSRSVALGLTPEWSDVLARGLASSPEDRYESPGAFGEALRALGRYEGAAETLSRAVSLVTIARVGADDEEVSREFELLAYAPKESDGRDETWLWATAITAVVVVSALVWWMVLL